jgi:enoyl-CoA hydratase
MKYETLLTDLADGVMTVTLNRPDKLNAISADLKRSLVERFHAADRDPATSVVVLRAEGRSFCAGYDIAPNPDRATRRHNALAWHESLTDDVALETTPWDMRKPVIASVQGHCLGGGCELAMMCDLVIADTTARFGQPEIKLGLIPGMGGTQRLTRAVGKALAMDMVLTGRMIDADEALRAGLVARVVDAGTAEAQALEAAATIAGYAKPTAMMAREAVERAHESSLAEGLLFERRSYHAVFGTPAAREGIAAFLEKRPPAFHPTAT